MSDGRITAADRAEARYSWLTVAECAERIGKSPSHVRGLIRAGALKAADMAAADAKRPDYMIRPEWVDAFVESRIVEAA